jgi:hypothetical protein
MCLLILGAHSRDFAEMNVGIDEAGNEVQARAVDELYIGLLHLVGTRSDLADVTVVDVHARAAQRRRALRRNDCDVLDPQIARLRRSP